MDNRKVLKKMHDQQAFSTRGKKKKKKNVLTRISNGEGKKYLIGDPLFNQEGLFDGPRFHASVPRAQGLRLHEGSEGGKMDNPRTWTHSFTAIFVIPSRLISNKQFNPLSETRIRSEAQNR